MRFVGFIDEARKRSILSDTDVFVQLSTREGLSIATLEALASGVPCVVSNLPGVREPITPGQTGWYVDDPEDVQSVVAALRGVLADRGRLAEMKQACRAVAVERYSLQAMCEGYWNVFTDLAEGTERDRGRRRRAARTVLVTGAAGFIGSALCRAAARPPGIAGGRLRQPVARPPRATCRRLCVSSRATFVIAPDCDETVWRRQTRLRRFTWPPCISFPTASRARRRRST